MFFVKLIKAKLFSFVVLSLLLFGGAVHAQDDSRVVDLTYGYTKENPVLLPQGTFEDGPLRERAYFDSLIFANQPETEIQYERLGSCCHFKTDRGMLGGGVLDIFEISVSGYSGSLRVYVNMYDPGEPKPIAGFNFKAK